MAASDADKLLDDLSAYLDGELDADGVHAINALLERSPDARRQLDELRQIAVELRAMPRAEAPDDLPAAILRGSNIGQRRNALGVGRELYPRLGQYTGMAAAAVLFFGLGTLIAPYLPRMTRVDSSGGELPLVTTIGPSTVAPAMPVDPAGRGEPPTVARAEIDERKLKSLGYVSDTPDDESPAITAEESLALAGRAAGSGGVRGGTGDAVPSRRADQASSAAGPFVNVVVETRTPEEFENVRRTIDTWNNSAKQDAARAIERDATGVVATNQYATRVLSANVRPGRANRLIGQLSEESPNRVEVSMAFNSAQAPAVQRLLQREDSSADPSGATIAMQPLADSDKRDEASASSDKDEPTVAAAAQPGPKGRNGATRDAVTASQPAKLGYMHRSTAPTSTRPSSGRSGIAAAPSAAPGRYVAPTSTPSATSGAATARDADDPPREKLVRRLPDEAELPPRAADDEPGATNEKPTDTTHGYFALRTAVLAMGRQIDGAIQTALGVDDAERVGASPESASGGESTDPNFPHVPMTLQLVVHPPPTMSAPASSVPSP
ncbi:MAG: hypothetical protein ACKVS9_19685 [Phycisphaerae bacterium]